MRVAEAVQVGVAHQRQVFDAGPIGQIKGNARLNQVDADITGAGATFIYPLLSKWSADYSQATGNKINYQSIGSGGGIAQIKAGTVDFGSSDKPLAPEELAKDGLAQFPSVIGGVVPIINVAGIDSPGLASSPAIAKYVVEELVAKHLPLNKNPNFNPRIKPYINLKALSFEEKNELIRKNPRLGQIICNCEKISLGELDDLMSRSIPPRTIKAVKKRTRAGFGKCQGGFCQPAIVKYLADFYKVDLTDVLYDKGGSNIVRCSTKECKL